MTTPQRRTTSKPLDSTPRLAFLFAAVAASAGCAGLKTLAGSARAPAPVAQAPAAAPRAFGADLSCERVMESYSSYVASGPGEQQEYSAYKTAAKKLASCGDYESLFGQLLARKIKVGLADPSEIPLRLLEELAKEGHPIAAQAPSFARNNAFDFEGAQYSAAGIAAFMARHGLAEGCGDHVAALDSQAPLTLTKFMDYFATTRCRPAGAAVSKLLSVDVPDLRARACKTLGAIGDPAHQKKIAELATADTAMVIKGLVKIYPVRDACNGALALLGKQGRAHAL